MLDLVLCNYFSANVDCGAPEERRGRNEESQSVSDSTDSYQMIEYGLKYDHCITLTVLRSPVTYRGTGWLILRD